MTEICLRQWHTWHGCAEMSVAYLGSCEANIWVKQAAESLGCLLDVSLSLQSVALSQLLFIA